MFIKKKNSIYITVMFFLVVMIGVAYAYLNTSISFNGNTLFSKNTWNVHFDNLVLSENGMEPITPATIDDTSSTINFAVALQVPGDYYEFTVDVVNAGSIDAMLSKILKTGISKEQEKYFRYTVEYEDGASLLAKDALHGNSKDTILVKVEYRNDIEATDIPKEDQYLNLSLSLEYIQDDGNAISRTNSLLKMVAKDAVLDTKINFENAPSTTNGQGTYIRSGTENDEFPIYYYRGNVSDNNVLFANFCWKMVRTTETGGVKLIYNGTPTDGRCIGDYPVIGTSVFNTNNSSQEDVRYIYADGTDSTIKAYIDKWYKENMMDYTKKLEDAVWCSDRSIYTVNNNIAYGAYKRNVLAPNPSLECREDYRLTVSAKADDKHLKYPVALLTVDEIVIAGGDRNTDVSYLQATGWSISPTAFASIASGYYNGGEESSDLWPVSKSAFVRPSISLAKGTEFKSGDGTAATPYIVE